MMLGAVSRRVWASWVLLAIMVSVPMLVGVGCGGSQSPQPTGATTSATATTTPTNTPATVAATPGTITASVSSIKNQVGRTLSIGVYDFDWEPGAPNTFVGLVYVPITGDDFSTTAVVTGVGADGSPTQEPAQFQPGTYSVVFFVSAPSSPPEFFTEIRATVAGDISVSAPEWGSW